MGEGTEPSIALGRNRNERILLVPSAEGISEIICINYLNDECLLSFSRHSGRLNTALSNHKILLLNGLNVLAVFSSSERILIFGKKEKMGNAQKRILVCCYYQTVSHKAARSMTGNVYEFS